MLQSVLQCVLMCVLQYMLQCVLQRVLSTQHVHEVYAVCCSMRFVMCCSMLLQYVFQCVL